jgi:hypothetical protein
MRKIFYVTLLILFPNIILYSQKHIEIEYEKDNRGIYSLYCQNNDYCNYTITISFSELINLNSDVTLPHKFEVMPGRNFLFELRPTNPKMYSSFQYNYKSIKGCIKPDVDMRYTYLMPIGKNKSTEIIGIDYIQVTKYDPEPKDWYSVGFKMDYGDTVYAARRGVVIRLRDTAELRLSGYIYSSNDNYIEIYHKDCSFGEYEVLSKVLVEPGQTVEAGEPIGLAGGDKYTCGAHVRFTVFYNYEQKLDIKDKDGNERKLYWAYVPLIFFTKENGITKLTNGAKYTGSYPDSIVTQEMTKRQIKKWKKNHGL